MGEKVVRLKDLRHFYLHGISLTARGLKIKVCTSSSKLEIHFQLQYFGPIIHVRDFSINICSLLHGYEIFIG